MKKNTNKKLLISPSLMCGDLFNLEKDLQILEKHKFDFLHIDIMDGHFVPNITFGFDLANRLDKHTSISKDIHIMMDYPDMAVRNLKFKKDDLVTFHIECRSNPHFIIKQIQERGGKVGIAINPDTPIEKLYPFLDKIDHVLVMTVYPGFSGHPFVKTSHERIRILSKYINEEFPHIIIGIDGAVGFEEIMTFSNIGVDYFVLGSTALFRGKLSEQALVVENFVNNLMETKKL